MDDDYDFENEFLEDSNEQDTRKKVELTQQQRNKIKESLKKMEENLVQPQYSCGRVFSGAGFASKPDKIIFKDFEIGVTTSTTIDLINISYSFNSFKLLQLDDEIIDFFEIDYKPSGRIPAGISTPMTLKFTPMVDKDYFSHLKLLSETGMVLIPIECLSKKCMINVINEILDYGEVILGQEIKKDLLIENNGALSCNFTILDIDKNLLSNFENLDEGIRGIKPDINSDYVAKESNFNSKTQEIRDVNSNSDLTLVSKNYIDYVERKIIKNKNNFLDTLESNQEANEDQISSNNKTSHFYPILKKFFCQQLNFPFKGSIDLYSKKSISFVLNSKYLGKYELNLLLKIEYKSVIEYKEILVKFEVIDLPLYTDKSIYPLEHLIEDKSFREKITIHNTSNNSYKLQLYNHPEINEFIEINPKLGYVQSKSSFDIWIKLKMKNSINNLNPFFKGRGKEENEFNFPLKISISNINIPIIVVLNFSLTDDVVIIKDSVINFEKCFLDESNLLEISMQNNSKHPMKYGFIMLPKEISAKKNIDYILSQEKISCDITYQAMDNYLGHREGDIFCKIITNDLSVKNQKLKYHIELLTPDVVIKPKKILFPVLPTGEKKSLRLILKNNSDKENYLCEWLTPPFGISGLTIMPKVFELNKNNFITCILEYKSEFRPYDAFSYEKIEQEVGREFRVDENDFSSEEYKIKGNESRYQNPFLEERVKKEMEVMMNLSQEFSGDKRKKVVLEKKEAISKKIDPRKDKKLLEEEEKKKREEAEKKNKESEEKRKKRIQEFNREKELSLFGAEFVSFDDSEGKTEHSKFCIPLCYKSVASSNSQQFKTAFIEVSTSCVEKTLIFEKTDIDFGDVSVQNVKTINLIIHNKSNKNADIKIKPLIVSNCFQLVNSVRPILSNSSFNFIIEFIPQKDITYYDEFCVYTEESQSTVRLRGRGVQPEISVNVEGGVLFIGNICANNSADKYMEITNKSSFDLQYEILTLKSGKKNRTGYKPFSFLPYKGCLKANSKIPIKVSFMGDHQDFINFYEFILVHVPNQKNPNYIFVTACCWNRQAYWREFFVPTFPEDKFLNKNVDQDYFVEPLKIKSNSIGSNNDKIVLEFLKYSSSEKTADRIEGTYKQKIIIGNCKLNDSKSEKNVNFEIILQVL